MKRVSPDGEGSSRPNLLREDALTLPLGDGVCLQVRVLQEACLLRLLLQLQS